MFYKRKAQNNPLCLKKAMEDTNWTRNSHIIILETFNDMWYERVVYIDSDMLIIEDIKSIFLLKEDIWVVLDNHYRDIEKSEIIKNNFFLDHILNKRLSIDRKIKNILSKFIKASILNYTLKVYRKLLQIKYKFSLKNVKKENFNLENKRFEDYEFNTGLLSIWKRLQNKKYRIDILKKSYKKNLIYSFWDQLVLNYYFYKYYENNILLLPAKFNALKSRYDDVRFNSFIKEKPKIIHYVWKKPWMKDENEIIQIGGVSYYSSFQKINSIWKNYYNELKIYEQKNTNNIS